MSILRLYNRRGCRIFAKLASVLPLFLLSASISAQVADSARAPQRVIRSHQRPSPDERGKVLARYLELDEMQKMALRKILEQRQQEVLQMRFTPLPAGSAQIDRFRAIQDKAANRIRAVLNQEQRKKYDLLVMRRATPAGSKTSVQDWLKAATPR
jgi:Spy/CpxP family protein refolding chaperone